MLLYLLFLSLLYHLQLAFMALGLLKPIKKEKKFLKPPSDPAILIVHRNDILPLEACLKRLQENNSNWGNWQVYLLDDHSDDGLQAQIKDLTSTYKVKLIQSEGQPGKKHALNWYLPQLKEEYIIQIDADCLVEDQFLERLGSSMASDNPDMLIGQVRMKPQSNIWSRLAALDHLSLQLVTFSALARNKVIMAAGASLGYRRQAFLDHQKEGLEWSGGEDTFIAQAMAKAGKVVLAQPYAVVSTEAPESFLALIRQRLRWGAKSVAYPSFMAKFLAASVAAINLSLVLGFLLSPWLEVPSLLWLFWLYKMVGDGLILHRFASLYGGLPLLKSYLIQALLYPFYIALVVVLIPFSPKGKWLSSKTSKV